MTTDLLSAAERHRCPTCQKVMGRAALKRLAPRIPMDWPSDSRRRAALEECQDGWCAICDVLPVKARKGTHRFTCGQASCKQAWRNLCTADARQRSRVA